MTEPGANPRIDRPTAGANFYVPDKIKEVPEKIREEVKGEYRKLMVATLKRYDRNQTPVDVAMPAFLSLQESHFERAIERVRLKREAQTDELTGLLKVTAMTNQYEITRKRLSNESTPEDQCAVVITFDLDFFRQINDKIGHPGADTILAEIGQKLGDESNNLRPGDIAGRVGGDEFAMILSNIKKSEVETAIQRIHQIVGSISRPEIGEVKSSFGALIINKGDTRLFDDVRTASDEATYGVKDYGRNGYAIVDGDQVKIVNRDENGEYQESYQGTEMPKPDEAHRIKEVGNAIQRITEEMDKAKEKPCFDKAKMTEVESAVETIGKAYFEAKNCNESITE